MHITICFTQSVWIMLKMTFMKTLLLIMIKDFCVVYDMNAKAKEFDYHWQTILNHLNHIHIFIHSYVSLFSQLRFNVCKRVSKYQTAWRDWTYNHLIMISNMFWKAEIYQCSIYRALPIANNTAYIRNSVFVKQTFNLY